jgi:hypothetical protein
MQVDRMPLRNQPDDARGILSHTVVSGAIGAPIPIQAGDLGSDMAPSTARPWPSSVWIGAGNVPDCQHKPSRSIKLFHQEKPGKSAGKTLKVADQIQKTCPL